MRVPSQCFLAVEPIDLRCGMDRLLVWVQSSGGAVSESVGYVFRNRAGSRIKLLLMDATGVWLCVRRLHAGRFHWPRSGDAIRLAMPSGVLAVGAEVLPDGAGWVARRGSFYRTARRLFEGRVYP